VELAALWHPCQQALWPVVWLSLHVQHCWCRAQDPQLQTTTVEDAFKLRDGSAPAVRLLFACMTPLSTHSPLKPKSYSRFVKALDAQVRREITITDVLDFVRAALALPAEDELLLLLLIDEGNSAREAFAHGDPNAKVCGPYSMRGLASSVLSILANVQTLV
jgi:hypothetical protein